MASAPETLLPQVQISTKLREAHGCMRVCYSPDTLALLGANLEYLLVSLQYMHFVAVTYRK